MTMGVIWGKMAEKQSPHIEHSLGGNLFSSHPFKKFQVNKMYL